MEHRSDATVDHRPDPPGNDGRVDEMVEESFPASDPPAGWAGEDPRDLVDPPEGGGTDRAEGRHAEG